MKKTLAVMAVTPLLILAAPPADAGSHYTDGGHCVSNYEVWNTSMDHNRVITERKWEVTGLGHRAFVPVVGPAWVYPLCDPARYPTTVAFAIFDKDGAYIMGTWKHEVTSRAR